MLPILRQQVRLLNMGAHDPTTRTSPAYYLRCMIAGTLEDRLPADAVAILTTDTLDATTIDHATVVFEGATETHVNKKTGEPTRHVEDVDGDGDMDLVLHFRLGDTRLKCGSTEAMLVGMTFDGKPITGADYVRMVGKG